MPKLSEFLFGKGESIKQAPTLTPQQQQLQGNLLQMLGPLLGQGGEFLGGLFGDSSQFSAPFMRQFEEQTIPGIAERFSAIDGQRSSAFGQQLGAAGAGLQENLASLQGQLGMQGLGQLAQLFGMGQQPSFENIYKPQSLGLTGGLTQGVGQGLGNLFASLFGGAG